jgi:two-component system, chemotaxis family, sensor kinase CheA
VNTVGLVEFDREAILATFLAETEEGLATMEQTLIGLESQPGDTEGLGEIFRVVHTLKGNAASLGLDGPVRFAHVLEDLLDELRNGSLQTAPELVTLMLRAVDVLRDLVPAAVGGSVGLKPAQEQVMQQLALNLLVRSPETHATSSIEGEPTGSRAGLGRTAHRPSLRVDIEKLDRMMDLTGEIAVSRGRLRQLIEEHGRELAPDLLAAHLEAEGLQTELQEQVMKARMVPVGPTFRSYARLVRDLSAALGKDARLIVEGDDVEVDTAVIEHIRDPLTHMIRNALGHGIEPPEERAAAGKDPCGSVTLRARHAAGAIMIEVTDDGGGLDRRRIEVRARARGFAEVEKLAEADVLRLIFEPGFSTADEVSDLSGRGIGLDVVSRNIDALGGTIGVESRSGAGTTFTLHVPLTLAIIDGLLVCAGGETYVVPLSVVSECLDLGAGDNHGAASFVLDLRGHALPCLRLRDAFALGGEPSAREMVVVVHGEGVAAGLVVDELLGERQAVIKPMGPLFKGLPGVAGSTILGSGRVALILDVASLMRSAVQRALVPTTDVGPRPSGGVPVGVEAGLGRSQTGDRSGRGGSI